MRPIFGDHGLKQSDPHGQISRDSERAAHRRDRWSRQSSRLWKAVAVLNFRCLTIWPRFSRGFPISRSGVSRTLLPLPGLKQSVEGTSLDDATPRAASRDTLSIGGPLFSHPVVKN